MTQTGRRLPTVLKPIVALIASIPGFGAGAPPDPAALPSGGQVAAGQAAIRSPGAARLDIDQSSSRAVIHWASFNIGSQASVNFNQPGAGAVALNRVLAADPSSIYGRLTANGQVFLVNPSGIVVGPGASVNTAGFVASTLAITDADFMAGQYRFTRNGATAGVLNQGSLTADRGYVALLGPEVRNEGTIRANLGSVALAAGEAVTLALDADSRLNVAVEPATVKTLIENSQLIQAQGGTVLLSSSAANALLGSAIRNTGVIEADSISTVNGEVVLYAAGGAATLAEAGRISARGLQAGETGGTVKLLGDKVGILDRSSIDASGPAGGGTVLLGGNWQGSGPEPHARVAYVGQEASIRADGEANGSGGKVVVWSDGSTVFNGGISARGGAESGDGGRVETSGHNLSVGALARVDAAAPRGAPGSWLLDPTNINVVATDPLDGSLASCLCDVDQFSDPDRSVNLSSILASTINFSSTPVLLQATNNINFNAAVSMSFPGASLTAMAGNDINVNASIATNGGHIALLARDPGGPATPTGTVRIAAGADLTSNGGVIQISTRGGATPVQLGANLNAGTGAVDLSAVPAVLLTGPATITGRAGVGFGGTIDGAGALAINSSGSTVIPGAVGGTTALTSFSTDAAGTTSLGGNVTTTGAQVYNDPVVLAGPVALNATTTGPIVFLNTVDGGQALTVTSSGGIQFSAPIGGITPLASLTVNGSLSSPAGLGNTITTTGAQTYNSPLQLFGNVTAISTGNAAISFNSTVDGESMSSAAGVPSPTPAHPATLTVNTTGATTFAAAVGARTALSGLVTNAGGTTSIASSVTTTGDQVYNDAVSAGAVTLRTVSGGAIIAANPANDFTGTLSVFTSATPGSVSIADANSLAIDGAVAGNLSAKAGAAGSLTFGDMVVGGNVEAIAGAQVTQANASSTDRLRIAGTTTITGGGNTIVLTDAQNDFGGAVNITDSSGSASITDANGLVLGTVSVAGNLSVLANADGSSSGSLVFGGNATIGGALSVNTGAGATSVNSSVSVTGAYNVDTSVLTGSGSLSSGSGTSALTLDQPDPHGTLVVSASSLQLTAPDGTYAFGAGSSVPGGITALSGGIQVLFGGTQVATSATAATSSSAPATVQQQTTALQAPPGPAPTVAPDIVVAPTQVLSFDTSLRLGASLSAVEPTTTVASIAPSTTPGTTASTTTTATTTESGSSETGTTSKSDDGGSKPAVSSRSASLSAAEKLLKLSEEEAARRAAREVRYKTAIEVIRRTPTVADIPLCGPASPEACMPAKAGIVADASRGADLAIPATEVRRKVAVLFGNNDYKGDIPKLGTPLADVNAIGKVLSDRFGYDVKIVANAGKNEIVKEFKRLTEQVTRDESVLVFYAGHGYQMEDSKAGFWIPVDGAASDPKTWVSNNDIQRFLNRIDAKQITVVSDSCFSGTLTKEQPVNAPRSASRQDLLARRAVVMMSSGDEEPVSDSGLEGHSIFAYHFLKELQGIQKYSPISVTFERLKDNVSKAYPQTPQLGGVVSAGHMSGASYLFEVK